MTIDTATVASVLSGLLIATFVVGVLGLIVFATHNDPQPEEPFGCGVAVGAVLVFIITCVLGYVLAHVHWVA